MTMPVPRSMRNFRSKLSWLIIGSLFACSLLQFLTSIASVLQYPYDRVYGYYFVSGFNGWAILFAPIVIITFFIFVAHAIWRAQTWRQDRILILISVAFFVNSFFCFVFIVFALGSIQRFSYPVLAILISAVVILVAIKSKQTKIKAFVLLSAAAFATFSFSQNWGWWALDHHSFTEAGGYRYNLALIRERESTGTRWYESYIVLACDLYGFECQTRYRSTKHLNMPEWSPPDLILDEADQTVLINLPTPISVPLD
jgi:hypothetical protein